ncbi:hypothetical protein ES708_29266 [subsurface metagenome]
MRKNKENIKIDVYAFIERLKEYPKFDYREAMKVLFILYYFVSSSTSLILFQPLLGISHITHI